MAEWTPDGAGPVYSDASTTIITALLRGVSLWGAPESTLQEIQAELAGADDPALSDERNAIYRDILLHAAEENWMLIFYQPQASLVSADIVNFDVPLECWWTNLRYNLAS